VKNAWITRFSSSIRTMTRFGQSDTLEIAELVQFPVDASRTRSMIWGWGSLVKDVLTAA
jgi:hypothetical protein